MMRHMLVPFRSGRLREKLRWPRRFASRFVADIVKTPKVTE